MSGAGAGGAAYTPAGAHSRAELTGLADGPQSQGCGSFVSEPDRNGVQVPVPAGIAFCRLVGPRNLNSIPNPLFMPSFVTSPALTQRVFFSSLHPPPAFHSPSSEGHKSGFRGKIWRRWELFSLDSDCVERILGNRF